MPFLFPHFYFFFIIPFLYHISSEIAIHGGSIRVKSEIEQGSQFTVSLPCQENNLLPAIDEQKDYNQKIQIRHASALILVA